MKKIVSVFLAMIFVFSAVPFCGLSESFKYYNFLSVKADAFDLLDLKLKLNDDGMSLSITDCENTVSGKVEIPSEFLDTPITQISSEAFKDCVNISEIIIPNTVEIIGDGAFRGCYNLESVNIPDSVTNIEENLFYGCKKLKNITIPTGVTSIGDSAFYDCISFTEITIPSAVLSIGKSVFLNCKNLAEINVSADNLNYSSDDGVLFNKNKTELFCCPGGKNGSYIIPDGVKNLTDKSFYKCQNLAAITIPSSVNNIGKEAFFCCADITSVVIPNGVTSIEDGVFSNCLNLVDVTLPDTLIAIGDDSFYATGISSVTIPNGVKTIGHEAFGDCQNLEEVAIPDSVTNIGAYAFSGCFSLKKVTVGCGTKSIGEYAFSCCDGLTTAVIPENVTSIGKDAFLDCAELTIYGKTGSVAQNYAKNNGIPFKQFFDSSAKVKLGTISNTSKGVKLTWSAFSGAEKYTIYRKSGSSGYKSIKTVSGTAKSYTDTTAKSGTKYTYSVRASNADGKSGYDKTGKTILFLSAPTTKVANKNGYIKISWGKISGAKGYVIYKKTGSGSYKKLATIKSGSTVSYKDKSVKSGTKYSYYVKAYNGSTYSGYKSGVTTMYLTAVKISSVTSGKTGITVKWGKVSASKGYAVYRKTGSGSYSKLATVKGATKVSYLDKSAKKGKTYTYYAVACNGSYTGSYANTKVCKDKY